MLQYDGCQTDGSSGSLTKFCFSNNKNDHSYMVQLPLFGNVSEVEIYLAAGSATYGWVDSKPSKISVFKDEKVSKIPIEKSISKVNQKIVAEMRQFVKCFASEIPECITGVDPACFAAGVLSDVWDRYFSGLEVHLVGTTAESLGSELFGA